MTHKFNIGLNQGDDIIREIGKFIKCPRCKHNVKSYRRKISTLDRKESKNICEHCLNDYFYNKPTRPMREKHPKATTSKISRPMSPVTYKKDKVKLWLSRLIDLLESNLILYKTANLSKEAEKMALLSTESRYRSDKASKLRLKEMFDLSDILQIKEGSEIEIKQMKREIRYADDIGENVGDSKRLSKAEPVQDFDHVSSIESFRDSTTENLLRPPLLQDKLKVLKKIIMEDRPKRKSSTCSLKRRNSLESLTASMSDFTEKILEKNFKFFFPKEEPLKQPVKHQKSSSEIIKGTIDMLSERAELEMKKKEELQRKKLEEEEKKRQIRLEKMKHTQIIAGDKKDTEVMEDGKQSVKLSLKSAKTKQKATTSEKSTSKAPSSSSSKKGDSDLKKTKRDKEEKEKPTQTDKERKLQEKAEKDELLRLEKEKKMQEKDERQKKKLQEKEEKERQKQQEQEEKEKKKQQEKERKEREMQREKERQEKKISDGEPLKTDKQAAKEKQKSENDKRGQETSEKKLKQEELRRMTLASKSEEEKKPQPKAKKDDLTKFKELSLSKVKLQKSDEAMILKLLQSKKSDKDKSTRVKPTRLSEINVAPKAVHCHKTHMQLQDDDCRICDDSELSLDVAEIITGQQSRLKKYAEMIKGETIVKVRTGLNETQEAFKVEKKGPVIAQCILNEDATTVNENTAIEKRKEKRDEVTTGKASICYALSNRDFIEKGWTMLPTEKVVRKMNVYRMRPAHPEFDWFEHNKNKKLMTYDSGEKLAEFDDDGKSRWYYKNGRLALDYYEPSELHAQQRFVVYSNGEPDENGRPRPFTILATFDYLGNGVVFDHSGKVRLKYNQTEGVVLDKNIGPVSHWKWHSLNDPPVLQQVMIDTQMTHKDPDIYKLGGPNDDKPRPDNEEMLAIEFDNFIKEKSKKLSQKFKPFQIKMKALKINEHFALKVLDQATVYLIFRDGSTNVKLNIGMILDHKEIVDTDTAEVGEVAISLERLPAKTDSLAGLQQSVAHAQRVERNRLERDRRLRPTLPCPSVDKLTAAASKPLRPPLRAESPKSSTKDFNCKCRKPPTCNVYYDTRLV